MTAVSKVNGIDKLFREQNLNILAFPQDSLMIYMSAASGMIEQQRETTP
jgi:amidase